MEHRLLEGGKFWGPGRGMVSQGLSELWKNLLAFGHVTLISIQHLCLQHWGFFFGGGGIIENNRHCYLPSSPLHVGY